MNFYKLRYGALFFILAGVAQVSTAGRFYSRSLDIYGYFRALREARRYPKRIS